MDKNRIDNALIKYFCCEDRIIVRIIEEDNTYVDTLEYYNPKYDAWFPRKDLYRDMFVAKVVNFREITREEAINYIKSSIEYFKRIVASPIYLRRIYGLDLEYFNDKVQEWQKVSNASWYEKLDEYEKVSKEEVDNFVKRKIR
ncbi:MAG: hypothetical protein IJ068_01505 [Bacilli bacterium]|nr:hypothetical protein [Bacilli bacterium]